MIRWLTVLLLVCVTGPAFAQSLRLEERAARNRVKGSGNAAITVYEFADFQCPYCAQFTREVFPRIDSAYIRPGKVQWIFVNLPLPNHAYAWAAAESAMCAGGAGEKFWPMHDLLYERQSQWAQSPNAHALFANYAREIAVDTVAYQKCVDEDRVAALIVRDVLMSASMRPTGTPAFSINGAQAFSGLRSFEEWQQMLEAALAPKQ